MLDLRGHEERNKWGAQSSLRYVRTAVFLAGLVVLLPLSHARADYPTPSEFLCLQFATPQGGGQIGRALCCSSKTKSERDRWAQYATKGIECRQGEWEPTPAHDVADPEQGQLTATPRGFLGWEESSRSERAVQRAGPGLWFVCGASAVAAILLLAWFVAAARRKTQWLPLLVPAITLPLATGLTATAWGFGQTAQALEWSEWLLPLHKIVTNGVADALVVARFGAVGSALLLALAMPLSVVSATCLWSRRHRRSPTAGSRPSVPTDPGLVPVLATVGLGLLCLLGIAALSRILSLEAAHTAGWIALAVVVTQSAAVLAHGVRTAGEAESCDSSAQEVGALLLWAPLFGAGAMILWMLALRLPELTTAGATGSASGWPWTTGAVGLLLPAVLYLVPLLLGRKWIRASVRSFARQAAPAAIPLVGVAILIPALRDYASKLLDRCSVESVRRRIERNGIVLPELFAGPDAIPDTPLVYVRATGEAYYDESRRGRKPEPLGTDFVRGPRGTLGARDSGRPPYVVLAADGSIPFGILKQSLAPLIEAGFRDYKVLGISSQGAKKGEERITLAEVRAIGGGIPSVRRFRWGRRSSDLSVTFDANGFDIRGLGQHVATGCDGVGDGTTIPADRGRFDFLALRACAAKIKLSGPDLEEELRIALLPADDVPWALVLEAKKALSVMDDGRALFPDLWLAIPPKPTIPPLPQTSVLAPRVTQPPPTSVPSDPPKPRGSATVDRVDVTGKVANANRVVAGMRAGFRACYNQGLVANPDGEGRVRVTAKIGPNGEVTTATAKPSTDLSASIASCIASRVRAAQFDPPEGGPASIAIEVRLTLQK